MSDRRAHFGFLSSPWLVGGSSLLAMALLTLLLWSPWERRASAGGKALRLYCAAGITKPVAEIIQEYQKTSSITVEPTYGGSGELLAAMRAADGSGDLYLAADALNMELAQQAGLVAETIPVAIIRPVLVVNKKTQRALQAKGRPVTSAADLLRRDLSVVLANEKGTSIGRVTRDVLAAQGMWAALDKRRRDGPGLVITAGTVNKVAETVAIKDGYIGVVWDAMAAQYPQLEAIHAPEFKGISEQVQIGVLKNSRQPTAALRFARYLTAQDQGGKVLEKHHFEPPPNADSWEEEPHIRLAAGAMLMPAVQDVLKEFERREGVRIDTSYLGCGVLVAQMKSIKGGQKPGHFPDAYFACDAPFLDDVQQWFGPGVTISRNEVVLIVPKGNGKGIASLADLSRPGLKVGLAHPKNSALGKLTDELLKRLGLYDSVYDDDWQKRIVHTDAAHTLVNQMRTGALDVAVVYRSNVQSAPANVRSYLDVIPVEHPDAHATQPFAIATGTRHRHLLERLRQALVAARSADRFRSLGFDWVYQPK
ncbi:MAG: substrate-binding domain-containing protein [Gemmataceae bacterium]|nr:substrate-binding domain-containing protein [Gemmataceae bacterium]